MSKVSPETIRNYERMLQKDPNSKVFAALADAYREEGRFQAAETMAREGIQRHPDYVGGYLTLARVLMTSKRQSEAEGCLKKAVTVAPENLLAYQLLGQVFVELKRPQEALKAHKMVLFLNPFSEKSRQAVEKLETLTAADYAADLFEIRPLQVNSSSLHQPRPASNLASPLERSLSLIDALIVRNELQQARQLLVELGQQYPDATELDRRWAFFDDEAAAPADEPLRPLPGREREIVERKKRALEAVLSRIEQQRASSRFIP